MTNACIKDQSGVIVATCMGDSEHCVCTSDFKTLLKLCIEYNIYIAQVQ